MTAGRGGARAKSAVPRVAPPVKAEPVALSPDLSTRSALAAIVAASFAHWRANESGVRLADDPEHVHQMRVALRRMRSALRVFPSSAARGLSGDVRRDLKRLARALGKLRELDVLAGQLADRARVLPAAEAATLGERIDARRAGLRGRLRERLDSHAHARLTSRVALWLAAAAAAHPGGGLRRLARARLAAGHRKVLRDEGRVAEMPVAALHTWRLDVKRARYAAEFFAGLFRTGPARRYASALARLQDSLGALTDINTARSLLSEFELSPESVAKLLAAWQPDRAAAALAVGAALRDCEAHAGYWRRENAKE